MGSTLETCLYVGDADAQTAYDQLYRAAQHEYGTDGYNGTISTSAGFFVAATAPVTVAEAEQLVADLDTRGQLHKWSPWAAVPVGQGDVSTVERRITVTEPTYERIADAVRAKVPARLRYQRHRLTDTETVFYAARTSSPGPLTKVWVARAGHHEVVCATRAEAVAAVRTLLDTAAGRAGTSTPYFRPDDLTGTVTPEFRSGDGPATTTVSRRPRKLTATAHIEVCAPSSTRTGWLFGGMAAI